MLKRLMLVSLSLESFVVALSSIFLSNIFRYPFALFCLSVCEFVGDVFEVVCVELQDKKVVVLANLKPRNMRGVKSSGMLMAASDAAHENVELLVPPEGSIPGDRVWFGSEEEMGSLPDAASPNQVFYSFKDFRFDAIPYDYF